MRNIVLIFHYYYYILLPKHYIATCTWMKSIHIAANHYKTLYFVWITSPHERLVSVYQTSLPSYFKFLTIKQWKKVMTKVLVVVCVCMFFPFADWHSFCLVRSHWIYKIPPRSNWGHVSFFFILHYIYRHMQRQTFCGYGSYRFFN